MLREFLLPELMLIILDFNVEVGLKLGMVLVGGSQLVQQSWMLLKQPSELKHRLFTRNIHHRTP
uniref:Uncharacterized protein n=1 Tax=Medicago truncatula TaxID=3880 RepID=I3TAN2_MEDTR|nr:unknown [Medicago truncatula]